MQFEIHLQCLAFSETSEREKERLQSETDLKLSDLQPEDRPQRRCVSGFKSTDLQLQTVSQRRVLSPAEPPTIVGPGARKETLIQTSGDWESARSFLQEEQGLRGPTVVCAVRREGENEERVVFWNQKSRHADAASSRLLI